MSTRTFVGRAGWVWVAVRTAPAIILFVISVGARAAEVLFPAPLHITREITSPFSTEKSVIDEYCHGNRIISISGRRTAIADHAKGEVTVIDFEAGTYSVTTFETIARLHQRNAPASTALTAERAQWRVEPQGGSMIASRPGEKIEMNRGRQRIRVTGDQAIKLNRAAAEALLGTAYPNRHDDASDALLGALRAPARRVATQAGSPTSTDEYSLPLEYNVSFELDGQTIETRNVILRVGSEPAPPDLVAIPPGAKLVESDMVLARRLGDELDRPNPSKP